VSDLLFTQVGSTLRNGVANVVSGSGNYFLLHQPWWEAWCSWVEDGNSDTPPPIENSELVEASASNPRINSVKSGIRKYRDFILVPGSVWRLLRARYGGGPCIPYSALESLEKAEAEIRLEEEFPGLLYEEGKSPSNVTSPSSSRTTERSQSEDTISEPDGSLSGQILNAMCTPIGDSQAAPAGKRGISSTQVALAMRRKHREELRAARRAAEELSRSRRPLGMVALKAPEIDEQGRGIRVGQDAFTAVMQCMCSLGPIVMHYLEDLPDGGAHNFLEGVLRGSVRGALRDLLLDMYDPKKLQLPDKPLSLQAFATTVRGSSALVGLRETSTAGHIEAVEVVLGLLRTLNDEGRDSAEVEEEEEEEGQMSHDKASTTTEKLLQGKFISCQKPEEGEETVKREEALLGISLPLTDTMNRTIWVSFVSSDPSTTVKRLAVKVPERAATTWDLIEELTKCLLRCGLGEVPRDEICVVELCSSSVFRVYEYDDTLEDVRDDDLMAAYQLKKPEALRGGFKEEEEGKKRYRGVIVTHQRVSARHRGELRSFGMPMIFTGEVNVVNEAWIREQIKNRLEKHLRGDASHGSMVHLEMVDDAGMLLNGAEVGNLCLDEDANLLYACMWDKTGEYYQEEGVAVEDGWTPSFEVHESSNTYTVPTSLSPLSLTEILETQAGQGRLSLGMRQDSMNESAQEWEEVKEAPPVLMVHLQRYSSLFRDRIDTSVDYPLEGLDLTACCPSLAASSASEEYIYDLVAICEQKGLNRQELDESHYTAVVKSPVSGEWYSIDGEDVETKDPTYSVSTAEILWYMRRGTWDFNDPPLLANIESTSGEALYVRDGATDLRREADVMVEEETHGAQEEADEVDDEVVEEEQEEQDAQEEEDAQEEKDDGACADHEEEEEEDEENENDGVFDPWSLTNASV